jgi:hypothetical protein
VCTYRVFGDESSDQKCDIVFCVGGVFGDETQWSGLISEWLAITDGEEFHAAEWDGPPARRKQYISLVHALAESKLVGWGSAMDVTSYERIFPNAVEQLPYYHCFGAVVEHFGHYTSLCIPRGILKFTFDQNLEVQYHASKLYHHMLTEQNWRDREYVADEISFATRKTPNIQVADLWTREVMKDFENTIGPSKRPMRRSLQVLANTHRFGTEIYGTQFFQDAKAAFEKAYREGHGKGEYNAWREKRNLQDNTEVRMQYMFYLSKMRQETKS